MSEGSDAVLAADDMRVAEPAELIDVDSSSASGTELVVVDISDMLVEGK